MKTRNLLRAICLLALLASFIPAGNASALVSTDVPPVDMFQLPWEQGLSWVAIDGLDNGTKRPLSSSHHYTVGGAIDFAPHNNMVRGEDTSSFWVTAAAAGTVVGISSCHMIIAHANGWITQYQFLANVQVKLGNAVSRNQHLGIIADGVRQKFCPGSQEPNVPHLHFMLRPTIIGATFAGWEVNYLPVLNRTTFTKNGQTVGLFKPLLNVIDSPPTPTPTMTSTTQPTNTPTPSMTTPAPTALTATSTTPSGPFVLTEVSPTSINIDESALVTVSVNNVPPNEYTSAEFTCTYDANLVEASNISVASLFGADPVTAINGPQNGSFIVAIAGSNNNKATTSGTAFTFDVKGLQAGQTALECTVRVSKGDNVLLDLPATGTDLVILGATPTPTETELPTSTMPSTPVESSTPVEPPPIFTATPTVPTQTPIAGWLTFTNSTFGYQFQYPPQGQIRSDSTAGDTIITDLPIVQSGTNLADKYLEVAAGANATECKSLFQTQDPGVTVTINGISFLKQTGMEGAAGSIYQWVAYATLRNGVCVSVNFILHAISPGASATPQPPYDYATETAIFDQIIGTYMWLASAPTATPGESSTPTVTLPFTTTPTETPAPPPTSTAGLSPTATPATSGVLTGKVIASKQARIDLIDTNHNPVSSTFVMQDGTFSIDVLPGTYLVVAFVPGFLTTQGTVTLSVGNITTIPTINLVPGDIDSNNVIDQFDAMTIGMSYNTSTPSAADLNNDGIINVLDLELLAKNYRSTGPVVGE
jgi:hypothetical protein